MLSSRTLLRIVVLLAAIFTLGLSAWEFEPDWLSVAGWSMSPESRKRQISDAKSERLDSLRSIQAARSAVSWRVVEDLVAGRRSLVEAAVETVRLNADAPELAVALDCYYRAPTPEANAALSLIDRVEIGWDMGEAEKQRLLANLRAEYAANFPSPSLRR